MLRGLSVGCNVLSMDTLDATVYSTSTGEDAPFIDLPSEVQDELELDRLQRDSDQYDPWVDITDYLTEYCFVCLRATDHRGEHDDLVEQGLATYSRNTAEVHRVY